MLDCASAYRPGTKRDLVSITKFSLRLLARRAIALEAEVAELDALLTPLVAETAPELLAVMGLGTDTASALLVAAGDNPERLRSEATFPISAACRRSMRAAARTSGTDSIAAVTAKRTPRCGGSSSRAWSATPAPATTSSGG